MRLKVFTESEPITEPSTVRRDLSGKLETQRALMLVTQLTAGRAGLEPGHPDSVQCHLYLRSCLGDVTPKEVRG